MIPNMEQKQNEVRNAKQRERYASLTPKEKKELLDKAKEKRANETDDERQKRLDEGRERFLKNHPERLAYQKGYNEKQKKYIKKLEKYVKRLQKIITDNGLTYGV